MRRLSRLACAAFVFFLPGFLSARPGCLPFPQEGERIVEVEIRGRARISEHRILNSLQTRAGGVYSQETVKEDIESLFENPLFRIRVGEVLCENVAGGVKVIFVLKQEDRIGGIRFEGVVEEDEDELRELLGITEETVISPFDVSLYVNKVREFYQEKGYYLVEVNSWAEPAEGGAVAVLEIFEGEQVSVEEIIFLGCDRLDKGRLEKQMTTDEPFLGLFSSDLRADVLQRDIAVLNQYARNEGFLDAKISLEEIRLNEDHDGAVIVIRIQEFERYKVGRIDIGFGTKRNPAQESHFSRETVLDNVVTVTGDDYRMSRIERDLRRIRKFYGDRGYIRAEIYPHETYSETEPVVNLTFWVNEEGEKKVRDVIVSGNTKTKDKVIRREITLYPGDIFNRTESEWSREQLHALQFFSDERGMPRVLLGPRKTAATGLEDLVVDIEEGETGYFMFTLGASTDGGIFGGGSINKSNFDIADAPSSPWAAVPEFFSNEAFHGGGQTLRLSAMPGTRFSTYNLYFYEPYLFNTQPYPISFSFNTYLSHDNWYYDVKRTGLSTVLGVRQSRELSVSLGFRNELIDVSGLSTSAPLNIRQMEGGTGRRSLETAIMFHKLDSPYNPTQGVSTRLSFEYSGGFLGNDLDMFRTTLDMKSYFPVLETAAGKTHLLILSSSVGFEREHSDMARIPIFEHFFVGGASGLFPLRGFDYRGVGHHVAGDPVGGEYAYSMSAEYMVPLYSQYDAQYDVEKPMLRGVVFIDAGGVAPNIRWTDEIHRVRMSYGVGLRIELPVFQGLPIALDYGIPWKKYREDERRSFSFSIKKLF